MRERLLCKETPGEDSLGWEGDGGSKGRTRESSVKSRVMESSTEEWLIQHQQDMGSRGHPRKAPGGDLNTSKKEVVPAATFKNSYMYVVSREIVEVQVQADEKWY